MALLTGPTPLLEKQARRRQIEERGKGRREQFKSSRALLAAPGSSAATETCSARDEGREWRVWDDAMGGVECDIDVRMSVFALFPTCLVNTISFYSDVLYESEERSHENDCARSLPGVVETVTHL